MNTIKSSKNKNNFEASYGSSGFAENDTNYITQKNFYTKKISQEQSPNLENEEYLTFKKSNTSNNSNNNITATFYKKSKNSNEDIKDENYYINEKRKNKVLNMIKNAHIEKIRNFIYLKEINYAFEQIQRYIKEGDFASAKEMERELNSLQMDVIRHNIETFSKTKLAKSHATFGQSYNNNFSNLRNSENNVEDKIYNSSYKKMLNRNNYRGKENNYDDEEEEEKINTKKIKKKKEKPNIKSINMNKNNYEGNNLNNNEYNIPPSNYNIPNNDNSNNIIYNNNNIPNDNNNNNYIQPVPVNEINNYPEYINQNNINNEINNNNNDQNIIYDDKNNNNGNIIYDDNNNENNKKEKRPNEKEIYIEKSYHDNNMNINEINPNENEENKNIEKNTGLENINNLGNNGYGNENENQIENIENIDNIKTVIETTIKPELKRNPFYKAPINQEEQNQNLNKPNEEKEEKNKIFLNKDKENNIPNEAQLNQIPKESNEESSIPYSQYPNNKEININKNPYQIQNIPENNIQYPQNINNNNIPFNPDNALPNNKYPIYNDININNYSPKPEQDNNIPSYYNNIPYEQNKIPSSKNPSKRNKREILRNPKKENKKMKRPKSSKGPLININTKNIPDFAYPRRYYEQNNKMDSKSKSKSSSRNRSKSPKILFAEPSKGKCFACDVNCSISRSGNSPNKYVPYFGPLKKERKHITEYDGEKYGYYQYKSRFDQNNNLEMNNF